MSTSELDRLLEKTVADALGVSLSPRARRVPRLARKAQFRALKAQPAKHRELQHA